MWKSKHGHVFQNHRCVISSDHSCFVSFILSFQHELSIQHYSATMPVRCDLPISAAAPAKRRRPRLERAVQHTHAALARTLTKSKEQQHLHKASGQNPNNMTVTNEHMQARCTCFHLVSHPANSNLLRGKTAGLERHRSIIEYHRFGNFEAETTTTNSRSGCGSRHIGRCRMPEGRVPWHKKRKTGPTKTARLSKIPMLYSI